MASGQSPNTPCQGKRSSTRTSFSTREPYTYPLLIPAFREQTGTPVFHFYGLGPLHRFRLASWFPENEGRATPGAPRCTLSDSRADVRIGGASRFDWAPRHLLQWVLVGGIRIAPEGHEPCAFPLLGFGRMEMICCEDFPRKNRGGRSAKDFP